MNRTPSILTSLGALVLGGFVSVFLSGIVAMQVYLYYKVYPKDRRSLKTLVGMIWALDFLHTIMSCIGNWQYLIQHFGDKLEADSITWSIAVTVALTAIVTFLVHCFFTHRIHIVSRGNMFVTATLAALAGFRLVAALATTAEMARLASYDQFATQFGYLFTMGLAASVVLDVAITFGLSYYLRRSKSGFSSMNNIIDSLVLYTVETGLATSVTTIVSLWVTMPHNLIFLGLHFTISKLYANSFMATLNSRATLRARSESSADRSNELSLPVFLSHVRRTSARSRFTEAELSTRVPSQMQISVQKTVRHEIEEHAQIADFDFGGSLSLDDECSIDADTQGSAKIPSLNYSRSADDRLRSS